MRKRSGGIHADNQESYLKLALLCQTRENKENSTINVNRPRGNSRGSITPQETRSIYQKNNEVDETRSSKNGETDFNDFDYGNENIVSTVKHNSPSAMSIEAIMDTNATDMDSNLKSFEKIEKNYKIMVVGGRRAGKHTLVNSIFPESKKEDQLLENSENCLDLIIKRKEDHYTCKKYQFWIRELFNDRYDSLIKIYYKSIQLFVFVYSLDDRESFTQVDEAIKSISSELTSNKFVGILIGNKNDKLREVQYDEGLDLKNKYNLSWFVETNMYIESLTPQVLRKFDELLQK